MENDIPLAVYSFEHFAIQEGRLKVLIRPAIDDAHEYKDGTVLNFAGNRLRTSRREAVHLSELNNEHTQAAGFKSGEQLDELGKCKRWLKQIGSDGYLWLYLLEPLERESNEPKA